MAVNIVTGRKGEAHITSDDEKMRNVEAFGSGKFVFNCGGKMVVEKISGDNTHVRVKSGMCMSCGCQMGIETGSEIVELNPGPPAGYKRHDLIVMQYTRDIDHDTEEAELVVIKGENHATSPLDPSYTEGDILSGDTLDQTPLARVIFNSTTLESIEQIIKTRTGVIIDPSDPNPPQDPDSPYVITAATIDKLWGSALKDGDGEVYN